jgi:simple sugar transport system ATP-binding protein
VRALTGDDEGVEELVPRAARAPGAVVARLDAADVRDARGLALVHPATVKIRAGEIIGVAGVEGSGVNELLRLLAGRLAPSHGAVELPARVGFVPEDRLRDAVIEEFTLTENLALRAANERRGILPWSALREQADRVMRAHDVRAPAADTVTSALSGGNQQKFVLGRELDAQPQMVVAENPVRGLDIRAAAHVLVELSAAAAAGGAVVIYSSDLDDVLPLADRMLVMFAGQLSEVAVSRDAVARAMVGAA